MASVHPSSVVSPEAQLADDVVVGPFCVIGPHVSIGPRTRLLSHVVVEGWTSIGSDCTIFQFASVGAQTQDLKYKGGAPRVSVGSGTTIREGVTIHAATNDGDLTSVGNNCHIMAYAHIAHDCIVGDRVILANAATLAGHVIIEDRAIIGGLVGIHQFVRIGRLSITGGCSKVTQDIPPYMMADGNPALVHTINKVGLERAGVNEKAQAVVKQAYRILYRKKLNTTMARAELAKLEPAPELQHLLKFIDASERGIAK